MVVDTGEQEAMTEGEVEGLVAEVMGVLGDKGFEVHPFLVTTQLVEVKGSKYSRKKPIF